MSIKKTMTRKEFVRLLHTSPDKLPEHINIDGVRHSWHVIGYINTLQPAQDEDVVIVSE